MTSPPSLTLWYSIQACSIVPHILLIEAGLDFELVHAEVDMANDERFSEEFKALNPKKRVPVLKMNDEIITEVPAIVTAISSLVPERKFLGQTTMDNVRVYEWLNYLGVVVHGVAFGGLYRPERLVDDPALHPAIRDKALKNLRERVELIESKMAAARTTYAVGDSFTAADGYLFTLYRWARAYIPDAETDFPHLSVWEKKMLERDAVVRALKVHTGV
ncbi:glutathione S-transferase [Coniochaeta sp. 2T2.1]|nr:glutathione S-transferase [Coniochaeta sp. 2T2.1]